MVDDEDNRKDHEVKKVLVVGDVMVDRYTFVSTDRIAPEAPIPVWDEVRTEQRLGGAANVAHNLKSLGPEIEVYLAGIVEMKRNLPLLQGAGIDVITLCTHGSTMLKHRYVDEKSLRYLFRADSFKKFPEKDVTFFEEMLSHFLPEKRFDAVIFSDYDKGTITDKVVRLARACSDLVIVDSKRLDLSMYQNSKILKVNEHEYARQGLCSAYPYVEMLFENVVVTKGARGAELRQSEMVNDPAVSNGVVNLRYKIHTEQFPVSSVNAKDVTGCGDTHTAAMAFSLLVNKDIRLAIKFANACAQSVVQKFGTSTVKLEES